MWHGSRTQLGGRSRHMFLSRGAYSGATNNGKSRDVTPTPKRKEIRQKDAQPLRSTEKENTVSTDTRRYGDDGTMRANPPKGFSCVHRFCLLNDGTTVSCQRTRSVRILGRHKGRRCSEAESHTGLMIAPPPPRLQTGLGTSRQHVRGAQHVLRKPRCAFKWIDSRRVSSSQCPVPGTIPQSS